MYMHLCCVCVCHPFIYADSDLISQIPVTDCSRLVLSESRLDEPLLRLVDFQRRQKRHSTHHMLFGWWTEGQGEPLREETLDSVGDSSGPSQPHLLNSTWHAPRNPYPKFKETSLDRWYLLVLNQTVHRRWLWVYLTCEYGHGPGPLFLSRRAGQRRTDRQTDRHEAILGLNLGALEAHAKPSKNHASFC